MICDDGCKIGNHGLCRLRQAARVASGVPAWMLPDCTCQHRSRIDQSFVNKIINSVYGG